MVLIMHGIQITIAMQLIYLEGISNVYVSLGMGCLTLVKFSITGCITTSKSTTTSSDRGHTISF